MSIGPVSEVYVPEPGNRLTDEPTDGIYDQWGYSIGYETAENGLNVPANSNTAIFRLAPCGLTEPVVVLKPAPAEFTVRVLQGHGKLIRAHNGRREVRSMQAGQDDEVIIKPGDAYSYVNTSRFW